MDTTPIARRPRGSFFAAIGAFTAAAMADVGKSFSKAAEAFNDLGTTTLPTKRRGYTNINNRDVDYRTDHNARGWPGAKLARKAAKGALGKAVLK